MLVALYLSTLTNLGIWKDCNVKSFINAIVNSMKIKMDWITLFLIKSRDDNNIVLTKLIQPQSGTETPFVYNQTRNSIY